MFRRQKESDAQLVRETLSGNGAAFEAIVDRYASTVFGLALAHLRHWDDAEDATQEVFASAYQSLHTLRNHQKFSGWLATLARNRCRRILKRRGIERALPEKLGSPQKSTLPRPEQDEVYRVIHREMDGLHTDAREVLFLYYFSRMGTREIARILGISRAAVAKRLQRARQALGNRLLATFGEDMQRRGETPDRKTRVMGVIAGLSPEWMTPAVGSVALKTAGSAPIIVGVLLMKKTALVALLLALAALGYFALPHDSGEKAEPALLVEVDDALPETFGEDTLPTLAKSEELAIELSATTEAPREILPRVEAQVDVICEIAEPSRFASISGTVRDEVGNTVSGVEVLIACHGTGMEGETSDPREYWPHVLDDFHSASGVSNSSGAYSISDIPFHGPVTVLASGNGYAPAKAARPVLHAGEALENVDVVVRPGALLQGRVIGPNRRPVAGAAVRAPSSLSTLAFTGDDGRFELNVTTFVVDGVMFLKVYSAMYGTESFGEVPVGTDEVVELVMRGTAVLRGHVAWRNGTAGTGARVRVEGVLPRWDYAEDGSRTRGASGRDARYDAVVDAAGDYVIEGIDAGQFYHRVTAENAEGAIIADGELGFLEPNRETIWNAVLDDMIIVHGTVRGLSSGEPLHNAWLNVNASLDGRYVSGTGAHVAEDKSYRLELPAAAGQYLIVPSYEPFTSTAFEQYGREIFLSPGDERELDLYFPEPFTIAIRVIDENGAPVSGAKVQKNLPAISRPAGETDEEGRFVLAGIMPTDVIGHETFASLTIEHPEYPSANTQIYVGQPGDVFPEETVVLYRDSELMGRIVDAEGRPLQAKVWVTVSHAGGTTVIPLFVTNKDGFFENQYIPATIVALSITAWIPDTPYRDQTWDFAPVDAVADSAIDLGELIFDPTEDADPQP